MPHELKAFRVEFVGAFPEGCVPGDDLVQILDSFSDGPYKKRGNQIRFIS